MRRAPANPKIYHVTHVDNLPNIIRDGRLYSDSIMVGERKGHTRIGMQKLKTDRFQRVVTCHPETVVADYVPFYFCPRSPMLFIASRQNHAEVTYHGGQDAIVHLEADFWSVAKAADQNGVPWAVSLSNAASKYALFRTGEECLDELPWDAIEALQWKGISDRKQAEFLVHKRFPWRRVDRLGVRNKRVHLEVRTHVEKAEHRPPVEVKPDWYY